MQERRQFSRWQIDWPAQVSLEGIPDYIECVVNNLNFKGAKISLKQRLLVDKSLKMIIMLSNEFNFEVTAWVVWHKHIDGNDVYGLYFTRIENGDRERIYKFMLRNFAQEIQLNSHEVQEIIKKGGENMKNETFKDRRVFARIAAELPLRFFNLNTGKEGKASTCDISAKGVGLVAEEELQPQTPLEMWFKIPDKGEPLYTRGEVVWSTRLESNKYRLGVNLDKADLMGVARILRAI